jgi:hypothetical protein
MGRNIYLVEIYDYKDLILEQVFLDKNDALDFYESYDKRGYKGKIYKNVGVLDNTLIDSFDNIDYLSIEDEQECWDD